MTDAGANVLVIGEALFDLFARPGRQLVLEGRPGGSPRNVAVGLARLGVRTALACGVSQDALGRRLIDDLSGEGVLLSHLLPSERRTTLALVDASGDGEPRFTFYGPGAEVDLAAPPAIDPGVWCVHAGSYALVTPPIAQTIAQLFAGPAFSDRDRLCTLDPNVRLAIEPDRSVWRSAIDRLAPHASLVKASRADCAALDPSRTPTAFAHDLLARGTPAVVLTDGAEGATVHTLAFSVSMASPPVVVADTVGAGDAFQSALIAALARRSIHRRSDLLALGPEAWRDILWSATCAAALACTRRGAEPPTLAELAASPERAD